ncbi:hypothetical protein BC835DRAFT_1422274 [Cytidiella melzeri]|nr:hypothetical protein BC835DRAFT_1422274 [Cytidiella melzeri]
MSTYQPLLNGSDELSPYLDEEAKNSASGDLYQAALIPQKQPSALLKLAFALCLVLSVSLAGTNIWASREVAVSLSRVLPAPDLMQIERADPYDGLSDESRRKLYYHGEK